MKALDNRLRRLERTRKGGEALCVLLRFINPDGSTDAILAPDGGGGWRPATEMEIAGATVLLNEADRRL